ncbi:MAG: class I SAM-dependent methyltransferase [Patescibacteria group bacterium]
MKSFPYKSISPERLQEYAVASGFGDMYPQDLEQFKRFLTYAHKILEVGCGTGRLGRHLIKDFDYTGVDLYSPYLDVFRQELIKEGRADTKQRLIQTSFLDFNQKNFDAIIFPWTVIEDFDKEEQKQALRHTHDLLADRGVVIIDNPAKGAVFNRPDEYEPTEFYYDDWKDTFEQLKYSKNEVHYYDTLTGRKREIVLLRK